MSLSLLLRPPASVTVTPTGWAYEDYFVHVDDYGAVGDYNVSAGTGTDDTVAIQAAIDSTRFGQPNAGKMVLFGLKRYKTTAALTIPFDGVTLYGPNPIRGAAVGNQSAGWPAIDFCGSSTDDCIRSEGGMPSSGNPVRSVSRLWIEGLRIVDRRTTPSAGDGIQINRTVNQTVVRRCDIYGFPTGASIRVTSGSGSSSDCVDIEDVWVLGSEYGIYAHNIDNQLDIRHVKCDTLSTDPMVAVVRVGNTSCIPRIQAVKHENNSSTCVTVLIESTQNGCIVDGVTSRIGQSSGYVVQLNGTASGVHLRGIWRQYSGKLLDVIGANATQQINTGTRLEQWIGGGTVWRMNQAAFYGDSSSPSTGRIGLTGQLYCSATPNVLTGHNGSKVAIRTDSTSAPALTVHALTSQTSALQTFYDTSGNVLVNVSAGGNLTTNQNVQLGGSGKTVGFFGGAGTTKGTISGNITTGALADLQGVVGSLVAQLASHGLITDSTT